MDKPSQKLRWLASLMVASIINFIIYAILNLLLQFEVLLWIKQGIIWIVLTATLTLITYSILPRFLKTKVGAVLALKWHKFLKRITKRYSNQYLKNVFFIGEERKNGQYRKEINKQIKKSKKLYFLLITGYNMYYTKDEFFVIKALQKLNDQEKKQKDIKIGLLDRNCPYFKQRANRYLKWLKENEHPARCETLAEYITKCEQIENSLRTLLPTAKFFFYQEKPIWRLHVFDDSIFVSNYTKDSAFLTHSCEMSALSSVYQGFTAFLDELIYKYPQLPNMSPSV